jgi:hypothetical protein
MLRDDDRKFLIKGNGSDEYHELNLKQGRTKVGKDFRSRRDRKNDHRALEKYSTIIIPYRQNLSSEDWIKKNAEPYSRLKSRGEKSAFIDKVHQQLEKDGYEFTGPSGEKLDHPRVRLKIRNALYVRAKIINQAKEMERRKRDREDDDSNDKSRKRFSQPRIPQK